MKKNPRRNSKTTSSIQNRRSLLRHIAVIGSGSLLGGLTGCLGDVADIPSEDNDNGDDTETSEVELAPGLEIGVKLTGFGGLASATEINPDEPGGGRLVMVEAVDPGKEVTISWRRTVKQTITPTEPPSVGVGEDTPTPETKLIEETGTISVAGLDDAHATLLPMFWDPGETTTDTSGIWLSREAFQELRGTRQTAWSADTLTRISWVGKEIQERIHSAVDNVDEVILEAESDFVDFDLTVDGQQTTVQAIKAHDSFGNEYIVLDHESNPLLLKFTYNAVSVGVTGFDTGLWSLIKAVFSGYEVASLTSP